MRGPAAVTLPNRRSDLDYAYLGMLEPGGSFVRTNGDPERLRAGHPARAAGDSLLQRRGPLFY